MVGSSILRKLKEKEYSNFILKTSSELDLTNQLAVQKFFENEKPEHVIISAAKVGGILANNELTPETVHDVIQQLTRQFSVAFLTTVVGLPTSAALRALLMVTASRLPEEKEAF